MVFFGMGNIEGLRKQSVVWECAEETHKGDLDGEIWLDARVGEARAEGFEVTGTPQEFGG